MHLSLTVRALVELTVDSVFLPPLSSVVPAEDRNAWYYPAAPRPAASIEGNNEQELDPGASTGNWGNKHVKGARWVRRGKITPWGPGRAEWEVSPSRLLSSCFTLHPFGLSSV